jgi:hypothetical protein
MKVSVCPGHKYSRGATRGTFVINLGAYAMFYNRGAIRCDLFRVLKHCLCAYIVWRLITVRCISANSVLYPQSRFFFFYSVIR